MGHLRWALVGLLLASTTLFGIGVIAERSTNDAHPEGSTATAVEDQAANGPEPAGAHDENAESGEGASSDHHDVAPASASASGSETGEEEARLLGVDLESTPTLVLAIAVGLGLAAAAASRIGTLAAFLLIVAAVTLVWAALDIREVIHQLDESRTGIALVALAAAVVHLAATAVSGLLASRARAV